MRFTTISTLVLGSLVAAEQRQYESTGVDEFGLVASHSGNADVHLQSFKLTTAGVVSLDGTQEFNGVLLDGVFEIKDSVLFLNVEHGRVFASSHKQHGWSAVNATNHWDLLFDGAQNFMVCVDDLKNRVLLYGAHVPCNQTVGVSLMGFPAPHDDTTSKTPVINSTASNVTAGSSGARDGNPAPAANGASAVVGSLWAAAMAAAFSLLL